MPETKKIIPVARPFMDDQEVMAAGRAIRSGWVTQGPEVAAFEGEFAAYSGAAHACAVSNCTTALHLALLAAGVAQGDEVITASHSFIATANSIRYCGATPVFVDIQPQTFNLDPALIERAIGAKTKAILCVHQIGMPCDLDQIVAIGRKHGLAVVEDAACAIGSEIYWQGRWEKIGKPHGDIACFSFHPRKLLSTGDGGMLTTNNPEWDHQFRLWRQHGMSVADTARHSSNQVVFESYDELGYNYRMTDIQAAIGRVQLTRMPEMIARRRVQARLYRELLSGIPGVSLAEEPAWARSNWQSYCIRLPEQANQRQVMQAMLDEGIATRRGVMNAHREPAYAPNSSGRKPWSCGLGQADCACPGGACARLAESELAQERCILLPLYHQLSEAEQIRVVDVLERALHGQTTHRSL
jgi:perosamine synthetase